MVGFLGWLRADDLRDIDRSPLASWFRDEADLLRRRHAERVERRVAAGDRRAADGGRPLEGRAHAYGDRRRGARREEDRLD
jgi:hypothetical protein